MIYQHSNVLPNPTCFGTSRKLKHAKKRIKSLGADRPSDRPSTRLYIAPPLALKASRISMLSKKVINSFFYEYHTRSECHNLRNS